MARRFYGFNSLDDVKAHIAQIKTMADLQQLQNDVEAADCLLTRLKFARSMTYAVLDCAAGDKPYRHLFMTQEGFADIGEPDKDEADAFTVLED